MMKKHSMNKLLSLILCIVLTAALALCITGCSDTTGSEAPSSLPASSTVESSVQVMGEGAVVFPFTVVDTEGVETVFEIHTDKTIVGEALEELGLLVGEEGPYGLYVKTVNGTTLDYDTDGKYWAFYVNGEYALQGVDLTEIAAGESYMFKAE